MMHHLRYFRTVMRHKWFVLVAGHRVGGIPFHRLLIHDWSKFTPPEWGPYVRRFESGRAGESDHSRDPDEFRKAFEHHWGNNPHHWEYWATPHNLLGVTHIKADEMPEAYAREMVADWMAAGRGYAGTWDVQLWYGKNRKRINIHPNTRVLVEVLIYG